MQLIKNLKRRKNLLFLAAALIIGMSLTLTSCYPGDPISVSEADAVLTYRDKEAVFNAGASYAMPDTVVYITEDGPVAGDNPAVDNVILSSIMQNMQEAGYTKVENPDDADVFVVAMATKTTWVSGGCYPWYWDWWWGYPGWCMPYYYSYSTASVFINMFDAKRDNSEEKQPPMWFAALNGVADGTNAQSRIENGINQAFSQSPYLSGK